MNVEDRLRATTEAVTKSMRPVRPLDLTRDPTDARTAPKPRRARPARRWPGWLVPLAAAAAVIAVAATLVAVRNLSDAGPPARVTPAATSTAVTLPDGVPRYYVALTDIGTSKGGAPMRNAFLGDAVTGKRVATFVPPPNGIFDQVAASADGKTFVLKAMTGQALGPSGVERDAGTSQPTEIWYMLRLRPGAVGQPRLTRIPMESTPLDAGTEVLAVSPDGRELAIMSAGQGNASGYVVLRTYSLATGRLVRTWAGPPSRSWIAGFSDLTWLDDDHTLAFAYPSGAAHWDVSTLNTATPGGDLIFHSRVVFSVPTGHTCNNSLMLTSDGKSVICGVLAANSGWCATGQLALNVYSVATGKLERVLYRYKGGCHVGITQVVWAKSATLAIGLITVSKPVVPYPPVTNIVGVVTPGKFISLPVTLLGGTYDAPGTVAF